MSISMRRGRTGRASGPAFAVLASFAAALAAAPAFAGGLINYEVGTADVGLASAGYGARAQDASTVFTNPAGMTRLEGQQFLMSGQVLRSNTEFSIGAGTSSALGGGSGGRAIGSDGWFLGGGGFYSRSVTPDLKVGLADRYEFRHCEGVVSNYRVVEDSLSRALRDHRRSGSGRPSGSTSARKRATRTPRRCPPARRSRALPPGRR